MNFLSCVANCQSESEIKLLIGLLEIHKVDKTYKQINKLFCKISK